MGVLEGKNRRSSARYGGLSIRVDSQSGDNYLFSYIENISDMGIFIRTENQSPVGTILKLRFSDLPRGVEGPLELDGEVVWLNPVRIGQGNDQAGMGVRFVNLTPENRERVVAVVKTIAYLSTSAQAD